SRAKLRAGLFAPAQRRLSVRVAHSARVADRDEERPRALQRRLGTRLVAERRAHVMQRQAAPYLEALQPLNAEQRAAVLVQARRPLQLAEALLADRPVGLHAGHRRQVVDGLGVRE